MIHYHGTPITPVVAMLELAGCFFCVSHARPADLARAHRVGQGVMLDNGAFSAWKRGHVTDWASFYDWCDPWLDFPNTWAVVPDVIDAGTQEQDALLREWPFGQKGAPVWHMDEPVSRLLRLCENWQRVCIGSTAEFRFVMSDAWQRRMDAAWNEIVRSFRRTPNIHMLRGMKCCGERWPFASADSTDVAQNHHRAQNLPAKMAQRWNALQSPGRWEAREEQAWLQI